MPNLGLSELIVILMILVLVFGASRLPQLGESMGRTIRSFKRGLASDDAIEVKAPAEGDSSEASPKKVSADVSDAEIVEKKS